MKKQFIKMRSKDWGMSIVSALLIFFCAACPQCAYPEGFKLVKVGDHYEPVLKYGEGILVSNGNIKAGSYEYMNNKDSSVGRFGFFKAPSTFFYVDSNEYSWDETGYGVYNDYLIADGAGYGSVGGHNHLMFLFQITGQSIKLLDVINQADININVYSLDFWAVGGPIIHIKDLDQNGHPEIKLSINWDDSINSWFLYMELIDNRLRVNLNPALYLPLYELEATEKIKTDAYYIYGFLAKRMDRETILAKLKKDKEKSNYIIDLLDNVSKWDAAFHHLGDEKFVIKQNNLGGK